MRMAGVAFLLVPHSGFFKRLGIRLRFLGDFSYLPPSLMTSLHTAAQETAVACARPGGQGCKMLLTVCIAYGSRNELARALRLAGGTSSLLNNVVLLLYVP